MEACAWAANTTLRGVRAQRQFGTKVTYVEVRKLVADAGSDSAVIQAVDRLLSAGLILSPVLLGPAAVPSLGLFDMKNDLVLRANEVARKLVGRNGTFLERSESLAAGHFLITYTAFFSAYDEIVGPLLAPLKLSDAEREYTLQRHTTERVSEPREPSTDPYAGLPPVSLPHPTATFGTEDQERLTLYRGMSQQLALTFHRLDLADRVEATQREMIEQRIGGLPNLAVRYYYAQYLDLMLSNRDFFTWATMYEHAKTQSLIVDQAAETNEQLRAVLGAIVGLDVGLRRLAHSIRALQPARPSAPGSADTKRVTAALAAVYAARIEEPIIKDDYDDPDGGPALAYPSKAEAFVPQAYRTVRYASRQLNLEDERVWNAASRQEDLAGFVVRYLSSPYSTEAPLLVLGQAGSGKSLLTEVIAARLAPPAFNVVRIELRDIDPETKFQSQIEGQIYDDSGDEVNWAVFAESLADNPLVIILDGYDELLQANGRVFSNYLEEVHRFQRREAQVGRSGSW
ncbi:hypothetical protein OG792_10175 [Micromonospora sp. NBC_01699]|uniref:NACHT N-terminal helical domain 7-containing protein n=1 Tax=Micromonospora sp. NBC_01699 TaxID=2975984 RepID=UPI002E34D24C|nr:hypothetical protein [Micromonospora sp. NBC_01699]